MKKTYQKPVLKSITLESEKLIAESNPTVRLGSTYTTGSHSADTKRQSLWDDDEW